MGDCFFVFEKYSLKLCVQSGEKRCGVLKRVVWFMKGDVGLSQFFLWEVRLREKILFNGRAVPYSVG